MSETERVAEIDSATDSVDFERIIETGLLREVPEELVWKEVDRRRHALPSAGKIGGTPMTGPSTSGDGGREVVRYPVRLADAEDIGKYNALMRLDDIDGIPAVTITRRTD